MDMNLRLILNCGVIRCFNVDMEEVCDKLKKGKLDLRF